MNFTISVKMSLVLFMLCSGFFHFTFASNRLRFFSRNETEQKWTDALAECQQTNASFVTLYDEEDANFTDKFVGDSSGLQFWLGLRKHHNITWSDGVPFTFNKSSVNVTNGEQICEAIDSNTWKGFNCSERKPFMCYKGNNYTLIENNKTWCQALQYCRKYYSDLVSISNDTQNNKTIEEGKNTSFWIGLLHDEWEWQDKSCSSFRKWQDIGDHEKSHACTVYNSKSLTKFGCDNYKHPLCSKGTMRIIVIKEHLTWEQALDYCKAKHTHLLWIEDGEDQSAVQQWLNNSYIEDAGPFWIGLRQSRVFGFWIWTSDVTVIYSNWKNDKQPELPMSNHCGVINKDDYKWTDENCLVPRPFLCEEEIFLMNK